MKKYSMNKKGDSMDKVIIIGGGIAGLSAGVYAKLAGFDVEIFEKNAIPGGECIGWNRGGFHIDNCIHWLTGTRSDTELYEVWETVGALSDKTEYADIDSFYTSTCNGQKVTLWNNLEKTRNELLAISPDDKYEINKFIEYVKYATQCHLPAKKPMEMWNLKDYILTGKNMMDFPKVLKEFGKVSLEDYSKRFKHPLLQKMMCDYLPKSYCTYSLLISYATVVDGNGKIPLGGSLQMSLRMEKRFKELGGKITYNSNIESIVVEKKKATGIKLADGTFVSADFIIPTVDTYVLFNRLLPSSYTPKQLAVAYKNPAQYPATTGFQIAYTVPVSFNLGETVFMEIEPLKVAATNANRMYIKTYGYDELYIKDGKCVLQTCISQSDEDYEWWKSLSKDEYQNEKEKITKKLTQRIEKEFPELQDKLEVLDTWTPLTYDRYCNAYHGSYMSFVTTPQGKQIKLKGTLKGIKNLYLAGQWTNSPGGLPIAVSSGKFAVQRILKKLRRDIKI